MKPVRIPVPTELLEELRESFKQGPMLNMDGLRQLNEDLVDEYNGLKVEIYIDEHPPPHFHVTTAAGEASYSILNCERLVGDIGKFRFNLYKWYEKNRNLLIIIWNNTRPSDCPVGPIQA